jgi:hypothetical protein
MNTKNDSQDRRGFLKGVAIGAGAYALGASLIYPQLALGQSTESYLEKIPMEARWKIASGANVNSVVNAWKYR